MFESVLSEWAQNTRMDQTNTKEQN